MVAKPPVLQRLFASSSAFGFALAILLVGRLVIDLARLHIALAVCMQAFYGCFLAVVGINVFHLIRGAAPGPELTPLRRWALAFAVPVALLASVFDCMGLDFVGCTPTCGFLMHVVAPVVSGLVLLYALTGMPIAIAAASLCALGLAFPNCVCRNPVNRWWLQNLEQSPACYASSLGVFLIASTTLVTRRRVGIALATAWAAITAQLGFWIGHHYFHVPW